MSLSFLFANESREPSSLLLRRCRNRGVESASSAAMHPLSPEAPDRFEPQKNAFSIVKITLQYAHDGSVPHHRGSGVHILRTRI